MEGQKQDQVRKMSWERLGNLAPSIGMMEVTDRGWHPPDLHELSIALTATSDFGSNGAGSCIRKAAAAPFSIALARIVCGKKRAPLWLSTCH